MTSTSSRGTIETIERGDVDQARERSREAENALNRLTRELEDIRNDPKALARRLAQRQEALRNETVEAVRETRDHPPQTPEGKATLANRLKPMTTRQEAIARLAATIPAPAEQKEVCASGRQDHRPGPRRLARNRGRARSKATRTKPAMLSTAWPTLCPTPINAEIEPARSSTRHGRGPKRWPATSKPICARPPPRPASLTIQAGLPLNSPSASHRWPAASERSPWLSPRSTPSRCAYPQRDRATRRALALADALENLRQQAPSPSTAETKPDEPRPLASWRVVGAFLIGDKDPFPIDRPVDLTAKYLDRKGQPTFWKPAVPVDDQGTIDLGQIYSKDDKLAAFGYTEIPSPASRTAKMLIGSDDTLTVWLNGKTVYDYREHRSYGPGTDHVDVSLNKGINRIVIKCGNVNGEWKFSVALSEDPARPGECDRGNRAARA